MEIIKKDIERVFDFVETEKIMLSLDDQGFHIDFKNSPSETCIFYLESDHKVEEDPLMYSKIETKLFKDALEKTKNEKITLSYDSEEKTIKVEEVKMAIEECGLLHSESGYISVEELLGNSMRLKPEFILKFFKAFPEPAAEI